VSEERRMSPQRTMQRRKLGKDGPEISLIGYGAWEAGGGYHSTNPPDHELIEAMSAAFEHGVSWVDTAEAYGAGRSEELVGQAVAGRDDIMVFTKVILQPFGSGLDAAGIWAGAQTSLRRLGREVLDLYQIHLPDPQIPVEESWGAMTQLVDEGVARYIGVSNFPPELVERCERVRHVDSVQVHFSLLYREDYLSLLPLCRANGIGILAYGPLGFGVLAGTMTPHTRFAEDDWRSGNVPVPVPLYEQIFAPGRFEQHLRVVEALRPIAQRRGLNLAQLALAWVTHQDGVTAAIAGARSAAHATEAAGAGSMTLSAVELEEIDAAWAAEERAGAGS
jgi:aryl-alcohol dehydrogenase-like predicted oxidoreductase